MEENNGRNLDFRLTPFNFLPFFIIMAKTYRCQGCGFEIRTGPYAWMLEIEEELEKTGKLLCPRCRKSNMVEGE